MKINIIVTSLLLAVIGSCGRQAAYNSNPDEYIIQALSEKRIVMLGDFAHEFPLPYQTLHSVLSAWLMMVQNGGSDQRHLTLFLEEDQKMADLLRHYVKTGDAVPWYDFILPSTSLERLEFHSDLRRLSLRIDSLNSTLPSSKQILFDIQGPEAMNVFDPKVLDLTDKESSRYFVETRDSVAALNVIEYLTVHPEQKALIFYGSGHLVKNIVEKPFSESLPSEERKGAFMAHYLKREYGENNVLVVNQIERDGIPALATLSRDAVIPANDIPWKASPSGNENFNPSNFDAFIVRTEVRIPAHSLSHIFNQRIVTSALRRLESLEPHVTGGKDNLVPRISGTFAQRYYNQSLATLEFLCDTTFTNGEAWQTWCAGHPCTDLDRLKSDEFRKRFADEGFARRHQPGYLTHLENLGFDPRIGNPMTMTHEEWNAMFEKMWPQVIFLEATGIAWVGESGEREKAMAYLAQASGERHDDPSPYMKWWRKKYFGATY